jgi:hypothetical protein
VTPCSKKPDPLAEELFGIVMDSAVEGEAPVVIAEFGCQIEIEEASPMPIQITPPAPETADFVFRLTKSRPLSRQTQ